MYGQGIRSDYYAQRGEAVERRGRRIGPDYKLLARKGQGSETLLDSQEKPLASFQLATKLRQTAVPMKRLVEGKSEGRGGESGARWEE